MCASLFKTISVFFAVVVTFSSSAFAGEQARCVQSELANLGFQPGPADGVLGRRSFGAASQFQEEADIDLPELTKDSAELWCEVLREFSTSPTAMAIRDQTLAFEEVRWNGADPIYEDSVVTFALQSGQCGARTYGDGRGESDCNGGRVRSQLQSPDTVRVNSEVEYYFEFFIPDDFSYWGDQWYPSGSRLLIAEWKRTQGIKNHIYEILLDNRRGVTFERETCITSDHYGKWNSFSLRIRWSRGDDGYLEARCNDRLILERRGDQTVIPPDCDTDYKLQCEVRHQRPNANIQWAIGPNFSGYGRDYERLGKSSPFAPFPPDGIEIRVRNLYVGGIQ